MPVVIFKLASSPTHKLMAAMAHRDAEQPLCGTVQVDDAYLGGEHPGLPGRGSPNKVPIVAAVQTSSEGHPLRVKLSTVSGFSQHDIAKWARADLMPGTDICSDGLSCFSGVIDAGCAHSCIVVGVRKPCELPQFTWVNAVLGNLRTMINGGHKAFKFGKYAAHYLGAFCYRFNSRFDLKDLLRALLGHTANRAPTPERKIREAPVAEVRD